jgi:hypothetical protein
LNETGDADLLYAPWLKNVIYDNETDIFINDIDKFYNSKKKDMIIFLRGITRGKVEINRKIVLRITPPPMKHPDSYIFMIDAFEV